MSTASITSLCVCCDAARWQQGISWPRMEFHECPRCPSVSLLFRVFIFLIPLRAQWARGLGGERRGQPAARSPASVSKRTRRGMPALLTFFSIASFCLFLLTRRVSSARGRVVLTRSASDSWLERRLLAPYRVSLCDVRWCVECRVRMPLLSLSLAPPRARTARYVLYMFNGLRSRERCPTSRRDARHSGESWSKWMKITEWPLASLRMLKQDWIRSGEGTC